MNANIMTDNKSIISHMIRHQSKFIEESINSANFKNMELLVNYTPCAWIEIFIHVLGRNNIHTNLKFCKTNIYILI
jgi:hypothetical protein